MNKKAVGLVLSGIVIGTSVTTFATTASRTIEVYDNVKKIVVDKIEKPFDSKNAPFTYNGTTYVPLRYISQALGENVDWDGKTGTVYIGDKFSTTSKYWGQDIMDMSNDGYYNKYAHNIEKPVRNQASEGFTNYLSLGLNFGTTTAYAEFPLNGQFKNFKSRLGLEYDCRNIKEDLNVKIYLDNKEVYSTIIKNGDMPKDISIDLTGANKIRFEVSTLSHNYLSSSEHRVLFGDGEFIK